MIDLGLVRQGYSPRDGLVQPQTDTNAVPTAVAMCMAPVSPPTAT